MISFFSGRSFNLHAAFIKVLITCVLAKFRRLSHHHYLLLPINVTLMNGARLNSFTEIVVSPLVAPISNMQIRRQISTLPKLTQSIRVPLDKRRAAFLQDFRQISDNAGQQQRMENLDDASPNQVEKPRRNPKSTTTINTPPAIAKAPDLRQSRESRANQTTTARTTKLVIEKIRSLKSRAKSSFDRYLSLIKEHVFADRSSISKMKKDRLIRKYRVRPSVPIRKRVLFRLRKISSVSIRRIRKDWPSHKDRARPSVPIRKRFVVKLTKFLVSPSVSNRKTKKDFSNHKRRARPSVPIRKLSPFRLRKISSLSIRRIKKDWPGYEYRVRPSVPIRKRSVPPSALIRKTKIDFPSHNYRVRPSVPIIKRSVAPSALIKKTKTDFPSHKYRVRPSVSIRKRFVAPSALIRKTKTDFLSHKYRVRPSVPIRRHFVVRLRKFAVSPSVPVTRRSIVKLKKIFVAPSGPIRKIKKDVAIHKYRIRHLVPIKKYFVMLSKHFVAPSASTRKYVPSRNSIRKRLVSPTLPARKPFVAPSVSIRKYASSRNFFRKRLGSPTVPARKRLDNPKRLIGKRFVPRTVSMRKGSIPPILKDHIPPIRKLHIPPIRKVITSGGFSHLNVKESRQEKKRAAPSVASETELSMKEKPTLRIRKIPA